MKKLATIAALTALALPLGACSRSSVPDGPELDETVVHSVSGVNPRVVRFVCDGSTGVYMFRRGVSAVANHPNC